MSGEKKFRNLEFPEPDLFEIGTHSRFYVNLSSVLVISYVTKGL
jgi:hypothetical protein